MNEKILVVDDEKEIADLLDVYLKNDGYTVYKFYNGTDALTLSLIHICGWLLRLLSRKSTNTMTAS